MRAGGNNTDQESARRRQQYYRFRKDRGECEKPVPEPARRGRWAEAWRQPGKAQSVSFDTPFSIWWENQLPVKNELLRTGQWRHESGSFRRCSLLFRIGTKNGMDAWNEDQDFHADGTRGVLGWVRLADKMSQLRSLQLPRGISTKAPTYSSRLYWQLA